MTAAIVLMLAAGLTAGWAACEIVAMLRQRRVKGRVS